MLDPSPAKIFKVDKGSFGLPRVMWQVVGKLLGNQGKFSTFYIFYVSWLLSTEEKEALISGNV